jgi:acetolactate synthase-1/2/3 large subunit
MNGAEALLRTLGDGGLDVCFANPGTSEMHLMAASARVPAIRFVPCLFEGVASGAADGYARMTRRPAATLLHLGPGLANAMANLHNARHAGVPLLNLVGEHPACHRFRDTPLASDLEAIARPVSDWLRTAADAASLPRDGAEALAATHSAPGRIATLAVPADAAWGEPALPCAPLPKAGPAAASADAVRSATDALRAGVPTALLLGGDSLLGPGLALAGRIAHATGAALLTPFPLTRIERGGRRPLVVRLPYVREQAIALLAQYRQFILVGATLPFAYFAYQDRDATLLPADGRVLTLAAPEDDVLAALEQVANALPAGDPGMPAAPRGPRVNATGSITPDGVAAAIARLLPERAIVIDEGMTFGRAIMATCRDAAAHDWLGNTGGSIGIALPLAIGASLACPGRPVLCVSADGSAMYTLQALWTIARESLPVTVVIFSNRAYALLKYEYAAIARGKGSSEVEALFDLDRPKLDFVSLSRGLGVPAGCADTLEAFQHALAAGFASGGPNLIEIPI